MSSLANKRIHMDRVYGFGIGIIFHYATNSTEHAMHRFTKVFAAMCGDKNQTRTLCPVKLMM